jgi:hypothetical protein
MKSLSTGCRSGIRGGHVPHGMVLVWIGHQRRDGMVFEGSWEQIKVFIICMGSSHQNTGNKRGRRTCNFICQRMTSVVAYISIGGVGLTQLRQASQTVSGIQGGHVPHGMVLVWIGHQR